MNEDDTFDRDNSPGIIKPSKPGKKTRMLITDSVTIINK
jgi:hypothetical protein